MLDIKFIRDNAELIKEAARKKHVKIDVDRLLTIDEKRRTLIGEIDEMRRVHKEASEGLVPAGAAGLEGVDREKLLEKLRQDKDNLSHKEFELRTVEGEFDELMLGVPNVPDPSVPDGDSDAENQEIRKWGSVKVEHGKNYMNLMQMHDMLDTERGAKVSGFRGYFLKNDGAMLAMALWNFTLEHLMKKGFQPFMAPSLVRRENLVGTGWLGGAGNASEEDIYKTQDDIYLSGTAEVPMMGYHRDEILTDAELPKKYAAFSPCYRREAGSYGKDTKGIFRVHEFFKVEQVILCKADHQESIKWHEELTKNSEEIMQALELPYHVVLNCGGDLGLGQVKKYDIEGWLPSEKKYRETHSASYFHDFQTRRLNIKYRDADGKMHFAHSLNNTAIATPRILAIFLENHQNEDGSINIPKALQKYFGKEKIG
ncbi:serine--tRNA ligase [Candidatus Giovannonibacteria bacterium RIFCSPHIGHO2_01_FULL_45_33]|uniref:Serine--tRNA ligase n=1 Tax=Candidatus Giovannonibacteria bacterium RIFCSPLOWO2_01_FULL_45_34 TaxID=1798351 RepID=A0A1F5WZB0_9BACT|nr:MAG: serine--tRNA ligase [Candidatus Giovannonibacteria bacterium RIFCSPHIGHO2_01_FULL_45_33]OGF69443.1 MAG: serine--tRNA ligase [Candidatus Giovannonibacteria bacterium RIFCSPHIGHO2_02_FULL_44_11]OGF80943.1 MAG: serine--tRNA ligase [Candidatus Giovannonibacteria bacterium RIFCSPLOWO2_01_FULL_45_34]